MALVSRRGTTIKSKVVWTLAYWLISVAPLLLVAGYLYNWGGSQKLVDHQIERGVHHVFKPVLDPTPTPAPTHHRVHRHGHGHRSH